MNVAPSMDRPRQRARPRLFVYLSLARASFLPTVWTNGLAGLTLGGGYSDSDPVSLLLALSLMYTAGMFLNAAFDADYDRQIHPERPIPRGEIDAGSVYLAGFGLLAAGIVIVGWKTGWSIEPLTWTSLLAGLIVYFNYRHRSDRLSPLALALCRVMIYFAAAATVDSAFNSEMMIGALMLAGYWIGLTYLPKQGDFNNLRNLWPIALISLPLIHFFRGAHLVFVVLYVGWVIYALSFLIETPRNGQAATTSLIAGISLLDALTISTFTGHMTLAVTALVCFLLTLTFERISSGFYRKASDVISTSRDLSS